MKKKLKKYWKLLKETYEQFMSNDPFQQSAVIAYYTLFSLPSLLVIIISTAGYFFGREAVQNQITGEIGQFIGQGTSEAIETMISNAFLEGGSIFTIIFGIAMLLFGATGAFFQLKRAMNKIWGVREKKENIKSMILDRVISFGMILALGFMMMVSLVISALVTALSGYISTYAPEITAVVLNLFNFLFSYIFVGFLFASIFKLLPDVKIRWKTTFVGASMTTILFLIGEYGLGFYFSQSNPASVYGGASSVVLILMWVYYTCMIMFFGAEFTVQYALMKGEKVEPNKFSEPAIHQEMAEMERKRIYLEKNQEKLDELSADDKGDS